MTGPQDSDRRRDLVEAVARHLLAHGLERSSLRDLAAAAGTSDRMLLYYFRDKADLIAAALDRLAEMLREQLDAATAPGPLDTDALRLRLVGMVLDDAAWPFMQVWLEIAARGARGDPLYRAVGARIAAGFHDWIAAQSAAPTAAARARIAARVLPLLDGLIVLRAVDLAGPSAAAWTRDEDAAD